MKEFIPAMCVAVAACALTSQVQPGMPNFAGRWVMTSGQSDIGLEVDQDSETLKVRRYPLESKKEGRGAVIVYRLDGSETQRAGRIDDSEFTIMSKAEWVDNKLTIVDTWVSGDRWDQVSRWSFDAQGHLLIEVQVKNGKPDMQIFRRQ